MEFEDRENRYDARTAVTFLLAGLGLGALAALILAPRPLPGVVGSDYRKRTQREPAART